MKLTTAGGHVTGGMNELLDAIAASMATTPAIPPLTSGIPFGDIVTTSAGYFSAVPMATEFAIPAATTGAHAGQRQGGPDVTGLSQPIQPTFPGEMNSANTGWQPRVAMASTVTQQPPPTGNPADLHMTGTGENSAINSLDLVELWHSFPHPSMSDRT